MFLRCCQIRNHRRRGDPAAVFLQGLSIDRGNRRLCGLHGQGSGFSSSGVGRADVPYENIQGRPPRASPLLRCLRLESLGRDRIRPHQHHCRIAGRSVSFSPPPRRCSLPTRHIGQEFPTIWRRCRSPFQKLSNDFMPLSQKAAALSLGSYGAPHRFVPSSSHLLMDKGTRRVVLQPVQASSSGSTGATHRSTPMGCNRLRA